MFELMGKKIYNTSDSRFYHGSKQYEPWSEEQVEKVITGRLRVDVISGDFLPISRGRISAPFPIENCHLFFQYPGPFPAILVKGPWPKLGKNDRLNIKIGRN